MMPESETLPSTISGPASASEPGLSWEPPQAKPKTDSAAEAIKTESGRKNVEQRDFEAFVLHPPPAHIYFIYWHNDASKKKEKPEEISGWVN